MTMFPPAAIVILHITFRTPEALYFDSIHRNYAANAMLTPN